MFGEKLINVDKKLIEHKSYLPIILHHILYLRESTFNPDGERVYTWVIQLI